MSKMQEFQLTSEEIEKYNIRAPRYTSYPTVPNWNKDDFTPTDYLKFLEEIKEINDPLSLYIHIPFCARRCLFCACNTIITSRPERSSNYLSYLKKEILAVSNILADNRKVMQLHLGGGTPTHFTPEELDDLFSFISDKFQFENNAEKSIEVHPTVTNNRHIDVLSDYNFNRISMGVQDFTKVVQEKLNRYQTYEETIELINSARSNGFEGVNVDLIYGLPYQTFEGFMSTIDQIFNLKPDRIAMYSYAHFPQIYRHHKGIPLDVIPSGENKLDIFLAARQKLLDNSYKQVGFDHFSVEGDELWTSFQNQTLRRNFMGYSTKAGLDLVAFGWSGISELRNSYAQNSKNMEEYQLLIDKFGVATIKGHKMTKEDIIRKEIIMNILCQIEVDFTKIEKKMDVSLDYLKIEANKRLTELEKEGFVINHDNKLSLTQKGQIFARIVASVFDEYLSNEHKFSTVV
jgi:oxygen-independent coproporphyrinogen III oxidase